MGVKGEAPSSFSIPVGAAGYSFPTAVPPLTSFLALNAACGQFSHLIQTLLFPTTSLPPVSFLFFLCRFNDVIGLYPLSLPGMSLNAGDTKTLVITVLTF